MSDELKLDYIVVSGKAYVPCETGGVNSCAKCAFYNKKATFGERCKLAECAQCPIDLDQYFIEKGENDEQK